MKRFGWEDLAHQSRLDRFQRQYARLAEAAGVVVHQDVEVDMSDARWIASSGTTGVSRSYIVNKAVQAAVATRMARRYHLPPTLVDGRGEREKIPEFHTPLPGRRWVVPAKLSPGTAALLGWCWDKQSVEPDRVVYEGLRILDYAWYLEPPVDLRVYDSGFSSWAGRGVLAVGNLEAFKLLPPWQLYE